MEAIRIAEEREKNVKTQFNRYDLDGNGSIDMSELLSLLDDLGLLDKLKSEKEKFASDMFIRYDTNDDGVLE